jgi:hypothetical protein
MPVTGAAPAIALFVTVIVKDAAPPSEYVGDIAVFVMFRSPGAGVQVVDAFELTGANPFARA